MKILKTIFPVLLIILIIIQFFRPAKNISAAPSPDAIATLYAVPENVDTILRKACNDCHSNNTRYPWYNNIQPVAWWLRSHINDGKRSLNFDAFRTYRIAKQYHRMDDIIEQVKDGEMPLSSYTFIHTNAKLTENEKATLINWADSLKGFLKATYPADSLVRKK